MLLELDHYYDLFQIGGIMNSASLAETVGIFWFWKPSEVMI